MNILKDNFDYSKLENIDKIYIPLKHFANKQYSETIKTLQSRAKIYIYMPTILKANYRNIFYNSIEKTLASYDIEGFVISNISNLKLIETITDTIKFELIANYTMNTFNKYTINELKNLGIDSFTISPESDKDIVDNLCSTYIIPKEMIVYGKTPVMNMNYCLGGKANKCYPTCSAKCNSGNVYELKDRKNMCFRVLFDNVQTVSTIYNSKITSISTKDFDIDCARIDILDESIEDINNIVKYVIDGKRFEGKQYTNGNLNRII